MNQLPFVPQAFEPPRSFSSSSSSTSRCREIAVSSPEPLLWKDRPSPVHHGLGGHFASRQGFEVPSIPYLNVLSTESHRLRYRLSSTNPGSLLQDAKTGHKRCWDTLCASVSEDQSAEERDDETCFSRRGDVTPDPIQTSEISVDCTEDRSPRIKRRKLVSRRVSLAGQQPSTYPSSKQRLTGYSTHHLQELQALVRGYCNAPTEQRGLSFEAKTIQDATGYSLVKPKRRATLRSLIPIIHQMDKQKKRDTAYWEAETDCRVEKSVSSGKYRYYSLGSNSKRVRSEEYSHRYMESIWRNSQSRFEHARQWQANFDTIGESCLGM